MKNIIIVKSGDWNVERKARIQEPIKQDTWVRCLGTSCAKLLKLSCHDVHATWTRRDRNSSSDHDNLSFSLSWFSLYSNMILYFEYGPRLQSWQTRYDAVVYCLVLSHRGGDAEHYCSLPTYHSTLLFPGEHVAGLWGGEWQHHRRQLAPLHHVCWCDGRPRWF